MIQNNERLSAKQPATTVSTPSSGQRSLTHVRNSQPNSKAPAPEVVGNNSTGAQTPTAQAPVRPPAAESKAQRTVMPLKFMRLETSVPFSAIDDNPVFGVEAAAAILGVSVELMKKWRQRGRGPDYIQYEGNGPVRYTLNSLLEFRATHTVHTRVKK